MKILILTDEFPTEGCGGAEISTFNLAHGLKKFGHDVYIVTTCRKKSDEGEQDYRGIRVFKFSTQYHERWRAYLSLYNYQVIGRVRNLIRELKPDVVHAQNIHYYLSYYCLRLAKKTGAKVFLTARDTMLFSYGKLDTLKYLKNLDSRVSWRDNLRQARKRYNPLRNIIIRHCLKYVDKVFAISQSLKQALEANKIKNIAVIYNGIDADDWSVEQSVIENFKKKYGLVGKKVVFFGGRISAQKGRDQINRAMVLVQKEVPEAVLLAVGTKGIGWLQGDDLKAAYYAADVVVTPSIYLDPFNRINIEAMACKKPVVGNCFGGTPEIIQDGVTGFIVNPLNTVLMSQKIIDLLQNPAKAEQFGRAGYERVKKYFSLEKCVNENIAWYGKNI